MPATPPSGRPSSPASILARTRRRLRRAGQRSRFELLWFLPVWMLLGLSRAAILGLPFRRLAPLMGRPLGPHAWVPLLSGAQQHRALQIGRTVRLAARYTLWTSNCFPQALTASLLLRLYRVPYALHLGLAAGAVGEQMKAHAWVASGAVHVTGGTGFPRFTVVSCFASPASRTLAD